MTSTSTVHPYEFAKSDEDAKARAKACYCDDPFPELPPSLLYADDILKYVAKTGMVFPFDEKKRKEKLKPASYEVRPGGQFIYWTKAGSEIIPHEETITPETKSVVLPPNSISYIQTEAHFRLPLYIAVRFNLRIKHVHRGILLGTGPIVDPGFAGRLLIPLHNLTSTAYELNLQPNDKDDGLIWIEFTKTTFKKTTGELYQFAEDKTEKSARYYLNEANGGNPVLSSIHDGIEDARSLAASSAASAEKSSETIRKYSLIAGLIAAVPLVLAAMGLAISAYNTTNGAMGVAGNTRQALEAEIKQLQEQTSVLRDKNADLSASLASALARITAVEDKTVKKPRAH